MKKTKLLIPLITLTATSGCLIPLVACNNKKVQVTEAEWQYAFDFLFGGKASWRYADDDFFAQIISTKGKSNYIAYKNAMFNSKGSSYNIVGLENERRYEVKYNKLFLDYEVGSDGNIKDFEIKEKSSIYELFATLKSYFYNSYKDITYNKESGEYIYSGQFLSTVYLDTRVKFNKDKKISKLVSTLTVKDGDESDTISCNISPIYEETSLPQVLLDRVNGHIFKLKETTQTFILTSEILDNVKVEGFMIEITPAMKFNGLYHNLDAASIDLFLEARVYINYDRYTNITHDGIKGMKFGNVVQTSDTMLVWVPIWDDETVAKFQKQSSVTLNITHNTTL